MTKSKSKSKSRNRNVTLNQLEFDSVDKGAAKNSETETYNMLLKKMTRGTIDRYRHLRKKKLIAETNFSKWIDNMILDKLSELEAIEKSRDLSNR